MEENEKFDSDFSNDKIPISEEFWNYMENYWHNNREFPESTEASLSKKADLVDGKVPSSQLPSYVDDVLEFDTFENLPNTGEKGKIYLITNDNSQFRWSGSEYIQLNSDEFLMTLNSEQNITGKKYFITSGGSTDQNNKLFVVSLDHSLPGITFYKSDLGSGNINFNQDGFNFVNGQASDFVNVNAKGFKKSLSSDDYFLTGGGGHRLVSDFATSSQLGNYLPLYGGTITGDLNINQPNGTFYGNTLPHLRLSATNLNATSFSFFIPQSNVVQLALGNANSWGTIELQPFGGDATLRGENIATHNWVNDNYWQKFELGFRGINDNDTRNFSFLTSNGNIAKKINVGGLLVSNAFQDEGLIPTNGAYIKGDVNTGASCWIGNRLITNGSIKHNNLGLSLVNISGSGFFSSVLIKTGLTYGNMGTFTVKLYRYAHEYFEFNVSNYKYNDSNYLPNITWKSGDSNAITKIEFLKDSNNVLYVNVVIPISYPRLAVTDLMVYGWDDVPFDSFNWGAEFDGNTTGFINEGQALPSNFLRDTHFTNQLGNYVNKSGDTMTGGLTVPVVYLQNALNGTVTGSQILSPGGDTLYIGNTNGLEYIRFETGGNDLLHYRTDLGSGKIWDAHNFDPNNYATITQLNTKVTNEDSVRGVAFDSGLPTGVPYFIHTNGTYVPIATQIWTSTNFFSKNGGTIDGKVKITPGVGVTGNSPTIGSSDAAGFALSGDNGLWGTAFGHNSNTGDLWIQPQRFDGGSVVYNINLAPLGGNVTVNNKTVATQSWVESQDYANHSFIEESLNQLTAEHINPDYPILAESKFTTVIITKEFRQEYLELASELIAERQITITNIAPFDIDVRREDNSIDKIPSMETTEYYITSEKRLVKKGSYRNASLLV